MNIPSEPFITGAHGAAMLAKDSYEKAMSKKKLFET
jgi:hypothetical protein